MVGFYKHDIPAWMDGTENLTSDAYRAYHVIIQLIMLAEAPITLNERGIAGRCNMTVKAFRRGLDELLEGQKLTLREGKLYNLRAEIELENVRKNRENAGKGGKTRAERQETGKNSGDNPANPLENNRPPQAPLENLSSLKEKTREEKTREDTSLRSVSRDKSRKHEWPIDYQAQVWDRYGKKVDKPQSLAALDKLYRADRLAYTELISGIDRQAASVEPQFRPSLERWIKREKWTDQLPSSEARNGTGPHDLFAGKPASGGHARSSYDAVTTGMAQLAAKRGIRPGGRADSGRSDNTPDHRSDCDDPEIEDAQWSPALGYSAAHH